MTKLSDIPLGITNEFACSYLADRQEQLVVVHPTQELSSELYRQLMAQGFRRSANQVYRPQCPTCKACQSLRIVIDDFKPSNSQKRIRNKNADLKINIASNTKPIYFELYSDYINARHKTGSMYPPTIDTMESFTKCSWLDIVFLETYLDDKLVSVAVCDLLDDALSAVYTFFDPSLDKRSLGSFNILQQVQLAKQLNRQYLYLGFQIDDCAAMNYKKNYRTNERFINFQWIIDKK
ncbi:MAG: arginyltransferase [Psychrobium sp.]|nr:arginyltransferase [Psychrobium sp.]